MTFATLRRRSPRDRAGSSARRHDVAMALARDHPSSRFVRRDVLSARGDHSGAVLPNRQRRADRFGRPADIVDAATSRRLSRPGSTWAYGTPAGRRGEGVSFRRASSGLARGLPRGRALAHRVAATDPGSSSSSRRRDGRWRTRSSSSVGRWGSGEVGARSSTAGRSSAMRVEIDLTLLAPPGAEHRASESTVSLSPRRSARGARLRCQPERGDPGRGRPSRSGPPRADRAVDAGARAAQAARCHSAACALEPIRPARFDAITELSRSLRFERATARPRTVVDGHVAPGKNPLPSDGSCQPTVRHPHQQYGQPVTPPAYRRQLRLQCVDRRMVDDLEWPVRNACAVTVSTSRRMRPGLLARLVDSSRRRCRREDDRLRRRPRFAPARRGSAVAEKFQGMGRCAPRAGRSPAGSPDETSAR